MAGPTWWGTSFRAIVFRGEKNRHWNLLGFRATMSRSCVHGSTHFSPCRFWISVKRAERFWILQWGVPDFAFHGSQLGSFGQCLHVPNCHELWFCLNHHIACTGHDISFVNSYTDYDLCQQLGSDELCETPINYDLPHNRFSRFWFTCYKLYPLPDLSCMTSHWFWISFILFLPLLDCNGSWCAR